MLSKGNGTFYYKRTCTSFRINLWNHLILERSCKKYSFAFGGKDGVPRPVNRKGMEDAANILNDVIKDAKIGESEKIKSLKKFKKLP